MKVHIITLFPEMFDSPLKYSIVKRAQEKGALTINFIQLRDFAVDKHGSVDEKPFGGGTGMLLRPEPIFNAVRSINGFKEYGKADMENASIKENSLQLKAESSNKELSIKRVILLSPRGKRLTQAKVRELAKLDELVLICGRYEGVDERVSEYLVDEELSIGDYVLTGAEIPAMVVVDSVSRLLEGVLLKQDATTNESFSENDGTTTLEHPQYTRPENFEGLKVPEVLLSGNHKLIEEWKKEQSKKVTQERLSS